METIKEVYNKVKNTLVHTKVPLWVLVLVLVIWYF